MTTSKRKNLDLAIVADRAIRELGFSCSASSESRPNKNDFKEVLRILLRSQLPGETYVYVIDHNEIRKKYLISKYLKSEDY